MWTSCGKHAKLALEEVIICTSSGAIANYFLDRGEGEDILISPMKVIKLSYLAHGWYLAFTDNNTLVNEDVEAWDHGPVFT